MNTHYYQAFGLTIQSELECPQLQPLSSHVPCDVQMLFGKVIDKLDNPINEGTCYQVAYDHFILKVNKIAKYKVTNGNLIIIEKHPNATVEDIRLFLYSTPFGALLQQRNLLTLHGSAIQLNNKGILFCGPSGSGKSSIAYQFVAQGASFISDDICALTLDNDKRPIIYSGFPCIQLWADMIKLLGLDPGVLQQTRKTIEKYYYSTKSHTSKAPVPVSRIYILSQYNKKEFKIEPVTGIEKFNAIKNQTFRFQFVKGHVKEGNHFTLAAPVANRLPIIRLHIPRKPVSIQRLIDLLKEDIEL